MVFIIDKWLSNIVIGKPIFDEEKTAYRLRYMISRERILSAAIPVFAGKGRFGARMEDIAALAHINKAMIYYIFSSKDELYCEVLKKVFAEMFKPLSCIIEANSRDDIRDIDEFSSRLSDYISAQIAFLYEHPQYNKILIDSLGSGSEEIARIMEDFRENNSEHVSALRNFIEQGQRIGIIRETDIDHLVINTLSMIAGYSVFRPFKRALGIEVTDEASFISERKRSICDLLLKGIYEIPPEHEEKLNSRGDMHEKNNKLSH